MSEEHEFSVKGYGDLDAFHVNEHAAEDYGDGMFVVPFSARSECLLASNINVLFSQGDGLFLRNWLALPNRACAFTATQHTELAPPFLPQKACGVGEGSEV